MQAAKDSFFMTLCGRLAQINPARTVVVDGVKRPAVLVAENERAEIESALSEAFCIQWQEIRSAVSPRKGALKVCACTIWYSTSGTTEMNGEDRGRTLGQLDADLQRILEPPQAPKYDYSGDAPRDLGTVIFWEARSLSEPKQVGAALKREVKVNVYFFAEEN